MKMFFIEINVKITKDFFNSCLELLMFLENK